MKPAVEWKIISRRTEKVERGKKCFTEFSLLTLIIHDRVLHPTQSVECEATNTLLRRLMLQLPNDELETTDAS